MSEADTTGARLDLPLVPLGQGSHDRPLGQQWLAIMALAVAAGLVFRLMMPGQIQFHGDEKYTFDHVVDVLRGGPWPSHGMAMSIGGPNPGMSVWIFILLGFIAPPSTPPDLSRIIAVVNILALGAFLAFILVGVPRREREPWLWGLALWAVNPAAVTYDRKIWPPCVLSIFVVAMLAGWRYRRKWIGSFAFAFVTVIGGQIHPTAAFLGAVIFAWTMFDDRWSFRFTGLFAGGILGFLPAATWVLSYYEKGNSLHKLRLPFLKFYELWFTQPFGFGVDYTLGPVEFPHFLQWPLIDGKPTDIVLFLHLFLALLVAGLLFLAARRFLAGGISPRAWPRWLFLGETMGGRLVRAAFWGFGTILTLLTVRGGGLYPHYLIVITPLMALWVALLVTFNDGGQLRERGRIVLSVLCLCGALITTAQFAYIDAVGNIMGEFGPSWSWQQAQPVPPKIVPRRSD